MSNSLSHTLDRNHHSWAVATSIKYEREIQQITSILVILETLTLSIIVFHMSIWLPAMPQQPVLSLKSHHMKLIFFY